MLIKYLIALLVSLSVGFVIFKLVFAALPKRLKGDGENQKKDILREAEKQALSLRKEMDQNGEEDLKNYQEELDEILIDNKRLYEEHEKELESHEQMAVLEEQRLLREEQEIQRSQQKIEKLDQKHIALKAEIVQEKEDLIKRLAALSKHAPDDIKRQVAQDLVNSRQIQAQKLLKKIIDDYDASQKRLSERMLSRVLSRYAPQFFWPKLINHVEVSDRHLVELLAEKTSILKNLNELAGNLEVEIIHSESTEFPSIIKMSGGFGLSREALRLTLEEITHNPSRVNLDKPELLFNKHNAQLEVYALELGRNACRELQLEKMHPKIQRLIGCLNWRTSYRQNQYFHSIEVSKLAGLLANELNVDPSLAKRCGILHDIGKALDFSIEGSHAVISGDYADRYGEAKMICDVVMSHHNDLILETPLAFVLKAADTLSGARPGARVNLEAGYHGRLTGIDEAVNSFEGIIKTSIMNGGKEVHVEVNFKKVKAKDLEQLTAAIAKKISSDVAFPGQIKVLVSRKFESVAVA